MEKNKNDLTQVSFLKRVVNKYKTLQPQTNLYIILLIFMLLSHIAFVFYQPISLLVIICSIILLGYGLKNREQIRGLISIAVGTLAILLWSLENPFSRWIIFIGGVFSIITLVMSMKKPLMIRAINFPLRSEVRNDDITIVNRPLHYKNNQDTEIYKWDDVIIHHLIGDIQVDMTNAAISESKSVIHVRNFLGKTVITTPPNYGVKLYFSTTYGKFFTQNDLHREIINGQCTYQSPKYHQQKYTVHIFVSSFIGDVEVITQ